MLRETYIALRHPQQFWEKYPRIMLGGIALTGVALAATVSGRALVLRQSDGTTCPGYSAGNVQTTNTGLTADLSLAGPACNSYGSDISALKLSVNYDTGKQLACTFSSVTDLSQRRDCTSSFRIVQLLPTQSRNRCFHTQAATLRFQQTTLSSNSPMSNRHSAFVSSGRQTMKFSSTLLQNHSFSKMSISACAPHCQSMSICTVLASTPTTSG